MMTAGKRSKAPSKRARAQSPRRSAFDPFERFAPNFILSGTIALDRCPVCDSPSIGRLWQLPQSQLPATAYLNAPGQPSHDTYLDFLPLLKVPQQVFAFDICRRCHSIFRNPKDDDQGADRSDASKVEEFKTNGTDPFLGTADVCEARLPGGAARAKASWREALAGRGQLAAFRPLVVDAACGAGQLLAILQRRHPEWRLLGLELSQPSVVFINSLGIPASVVDLDLDDLDAVVAPASVDLVLFIEAFEHVRKPLTVLKKLVRMLRPGGRLYFTAQYYGPENELQIRVGEPIYIDRHGLDWLIKQLDATVIEITADIKLRVTLEKQ